MPNGVFPPGQVWGAVLGGLMRSLRASGVLDLSRYNPVRKSVVFGLAQRAAAAGVPHDAFRRALDRAGVTEWTRDLPGVYEQQYQQGLVRRAYKELDKDVTITRGVELPGGVEIPEVRSTIPDALYLHKVEVTYLDAEGRARSRILTTYSTEALSRRDVEEGMWDWIAPEGQVAESYRQRYGIEEVVRIEHIETAHHVGAPW